MRLVAGGDPSGEGCPCSGLGRAGRLEAERADRCDGRLVAKLADRAILVASVLLVPDRRRGCRADERNRQNGDPCAPAATP